MGAVPGTSSQASPPFSSFTSLGARSWNFLGRYLVHMSGCSITCPSAEMSRYSRAIAPPQTSLHRREPPTTVGPPAFSDFRVSLLRGTPADETGHRRATRLSAPSIALEFGGPPLGEGPQPLAGVGRAHDELLR